MGLTAERRRRMPGKLNPRELLNPAPRRHLDHG
jgi:hypothetical protein